MKQFVIYDLIWCIWCNNRTTIIQKNNMLLSILKATAGGFFVFTVNKFHGKIKTN